MCVIRVLGLLAAVGVLGEVYIQTPGAILTGGDVGDAFALDRDPIVPADHQGDSRRGADVTVLAGLDGGIRDDLGVSVAATPTRAACGASSGPRVATTASLN